MKNSNFVPVDLTSVSVDVTWWKAHVGGPEPFYEFQKKTVDLRSSTKVTGNVSVKGL